MNALLGIVGEEEFRPHQIGSGVVSGKNGTRIRCRLLRLIPELKKGHSRFYPVSPLLHNERPGVLSVRLPLPVLMEPAGNPLLSESFRQGHFIDNLEFELDFLSVPAPCLNYPLSSEATPLAQ